MNMNMNIMNLMNSMSQMNPTNQMGLMMNMPNQKELIALWFEKMENLHRK